MSFSGPNTHFGYLEIDTNLTDGYHREMYRLTYHKSALKTLFKMPRAIANRITSELASIAGNPDAYKGDWKPLSGTPFWRLRVGGWRAVCEVNGDELVV